MAGLASLASKISQNTERTKQSAVYLITLDPQTDSPTFAATLQYFPESLSDSKTVSWQSKEVPGGSLPLYQWTGSGERTLSFTAQFSSDIDYLAPRSPDALDLRTRLRNAGQNNYNVDIRSAVVWLRSHMLPTYDKSGRSVAPPKLMLYIPRSGIGLAGGSTSISQQNVDAVVCVMTQCEISWEKFFASGAPRLASVSLAFAQVPQYQGKVQFPTADAAMLQGRDGAGFGNIGATNSFLGYQPEYRTSTPIVGFPQLFGAP